MIQAGPNVVGGYIILRPVSGLMAGDYRVRIHPFWCRKFLVLIALVTWQPVEIGIHNVFYRLFSRLFSRLSSRVFRRRVDILLRCHFH